MFFEICLVAAGWHFGRKLWNSLAEDVPSPRDASSSRVVRIPLLGVDDGAPNPANHVVSEANDVVSTPFDVEVKEIDAQFNTALVATGLTTAGPLFMPQLRELGGVVVLYGSIPIFEKAIHSLVEHRRVGIDVLDSIVLLTSLGARQYTVCALMSLMYAGGQKLRINRERSLRRRMTDIWGCKPDRVRILDEDGERVVAAEALREGDIVVVGAGEPIPADGVVTRGIALVDQRPLTGESVLVEKNAGERVYAMTSVSSGKLFVRVEKSGNETSAARIRASLRRNSSFTHSIELESKERADASALPILALSALSYPIVGLWGSAALLNVGFADTLRVAAPLGMVLVLQKAYDSGILVKDGRSLQLLPTVDTVLLDMQAVLRPEAADVVRVLRARKLTVLLLSGESETSTRILAERLGITVWRAELSPAHKARIVNDLQAQGKRVCFVGDGVNDALALEQATVSISMNSGVVAVDSAQVMLMEQRIGKVPELFEMAADFRSKQRRITLSAVIPAAVAVGGVFVAGFTPNAAVTCYFVSLASGVGIAMSPQRNRAARDSNMVEVH